MAGRDRTCGELIELVRELFGADDRVGDRSAGLFDATRNLSLFFGGSRLLVRNLIPDKRADEGADEKDSAKDEEDDLCAETSARLLLFLV